MRALSLIIAQFGLLASLSAQAQPVTVRVRGATHLEARARLEGDKITIKGRLLDDVERGVPGAALTVNALQPTESPLAFEQAETCVDGLLSPRKGPGLSVLTSGTGEYCFRLRSDIAPASLRIGFNGDRYRDPASGVRLALDNLSAALNLSFSSPPRLLPLERAGHSLRVLPNVARSLYRAQPLELTLTMTAPGARPVELGKRIAYNGKPVDFPILSSSLGAVGPALLTVRYEGSAEVSVAEVSTVVKRTALVGISLISAETSNQGTTAVVRVSSVLGPIESGAVEALVGGQTIGTSPVAIGMATLHFPLEQLHSTELPVTFRYLPDVEGWIPNAELVTTIPFRSGSPWRLWPWMLSAAMLTLWIARAWLRPTRAARLSKPNRAEIPKGEPGIEFLDLNGSSSGWSGQVRDAHDGTPIANATVRLLLPGFGNAEPSISTLTSADGSFTLEAPNALPEGSQFQVGAPYHATLLRGLPPQGRLCIAIVHRRRALLDRFVAWRSRVLSPRKSAPESTPSELAAIAEKQGKQEIAVWARHVEAAVYGPDPLDDLAEDAVRAHEPRGISPLER